MKSAATGGADAWPSKKYLNLWVCTRRDLLLGYAQFPGLPPATDGVWVDRPIAPGDGNLAVPGTWEMQGADALCLRGAEGRAAPRMLRLLSVEQDQLVVQEAG